MNMYIFQILDTLCKPGCKANTSFSSWSGKWLMKWRNKTRTLNQAKARTVLQLNQAKARTVLQLMLQFFLENWREKEESCTHRATTNPWRFVGKRRKTSLIRRSLRFFATVSAKETSPYIRAYKLNQTLKDEVRFLKVFPCHSSGRNRFPHVFHVNICALRSPKVKWPYLLTYLLT